MKKIFVTLSVALAVGTAFAVPAKQAKKVLTLADGTHVTATLVGDEFMNWWESDNGLKYVEHDGVAVLANTELMEANANQQRALINQQRVQRMGKVLNTFNTPKADGPLRADIGGSHITYTGKKKGIVILVDFTNQKFQDGHDNEYYNRVLNERGFTNDEGYIGSVSDYFLAQSNGQFELDFDVAGPYHLKHTVSYYGKNDDTYGRTDVNVGKMIKDACDAAAAEGFNFNDYDWDGDGYADQVFVLYAGYGEASSLNKPETVWPHEYQVRYTTIGKPLSYVAEGKGKVDTYACANEIEQVINTSTGQYTNQTKVAGIGTICHEFSHCLGFADMYDTDNNGGANANYGMGFLDVMCSGSYNGGGFVPCNYTAYERIYAGWTEPIVLDEPATVKSMKSSNDYGRPFIMYNDKNNKEFFTFENRQKVGWDASIYGQGLMITHVDYDSTVWGTNKVNGSSQDHQRCTIFHADNSAGTKTVLDYECDLYPYLDDDGSVINDELTDDSRPSARLYNMNADGTKFMGKPVTSIALNSDGTVDFLVMGGDDSNVLDNETVTAIANVKNDVKSADSRVYSIDGRSLGNDVNALGKGLYVVGGKKLLKTK